jgi:hypothetical protein
MTAHQRQGSTTHNDIQLYRLIILESNDESRAQQQQGNKPGTLQNSDEGRFPRRPEPEGERLQREQHAGELFPGLRVDEVAVGVELLGGLVRLGEHLRLVEEVDVEEYPDLADVVLRAAAAGAARRAQDRGRPVREAVGRARPPVQGVLQRARHGVVVLGRGEEEAVGRAHPAAERLHGRREAAVHLEVRVQQGQARDVDEVHLQPRDGVPANLRGFANRTRY